MTDDPDRTGPPAAGRIDLPAALSRHPIYLFDGVCRLCNGAVRFLLRWDRHGEFRFVAVQSALGQRILNHLGLPPDDWESFVYIEESRPYLKSDGVLRILRRLPLPWPWLGILRLVPRVARDWAYDRVAGNRYAVFGRYRSCPRPPPDIADRFLE